MPIEKTKALVGLSDTAQKISRWIRPLVFARATPIDKITVSHLNINNKKEPIASFDLEDVTEKDLITLSNEIESAAFADAEGLGGLQRYVAQAYQGESTEPIGRLPFRIRGNDEEEGDAIDSEPATPKGLVSQAQRFSEAAVRMALGSSGQIISTMQRQIARQQDTIDKLTNDRMEVFNMLEEMRSEKQSRDIELDEAKLKSQIKKDAYDKLAMLAPVVINRLAGQKLLPEKLTPVQTMLKTLAESIKPHQMEHFRAVLEPEQLIMLAEFMQSTQTEESAPQEETSLTTSTEKKG